MKKHFGMIAAALTCALMLSFAGAGTASAEQIDEQYVVEEDGQTVVYITTYVDPDDVIAGQTVTWYDGNGTRFVHTYQARPQQDPGFSCYVTWYDGAGNKYVRDDRAQTVTVYDADGNVIAVMPA